VGTGGLGAPLAYFWQAAGVGTIGLGRLRYGGCEQPAAADYPLDGYGRHAEGGFAEIKLRGINPDLKVVEVQHDADERECVGDLQRLRHHCRWYGTTSDPLPGKRCGAY